MKLKVYLEKPTKDKPKKDCISGRLKSNKIIYYLKFSILNSKLEKEVDNIVY